jgi:Protein of unknown function (DUF1214)
LIAVTMALHAFAMPATLAACNALYRKLEAHPGFFGGVRVLRRKGVMVDRPTAWETGTTSALPPSNVGSPEVRRDGVGRLLPFRASKKPQSSALPDSVSHLKLEQTRSASRLDLLCHASSSKSPGKDKESNWLPAPNDVIYLVMRLYWPKTEPPSVLPPGEGTWKPPVIVESK